MSDCGGAGQVGRAVPGDGVRRVGMVVSARFRVLLQYRAAAIAGLGTQIFFGLVLVMIYEAFYRSSTAAGCRRR